MGHIECGTRDTLLEYERYLVILGGMATGLATQHASPTISCHHVFLFRYCFYLAIYKVLLGKWRITALSFVLNVHA